MKHPAPAIVGLGCAAPAHRRTQAEALAAALSLSPPRTDSERRQVEAIYRKSGVESRGVAGGTFDRSAGEPADPFGIFLPGGPGEWRGPSTRERMAEYTRRATELAVRASRAALHDASVAPAGITHLVTASCTGFAAPGWDQELIQQIGVSPSVARCHVGFMGCHAAINALRVGAAFARADPPARVLVCCAEVCSLHFQYLAPPDGVVANALFADGASAVVVAADAPAPIARLGSFASRILADSKDQMGWEIGDHGFEMRLGTELPRTIAAGAGPWLAGWLDQAGIRMAEVGSWAVHPGGPKILSAVGEALSLAAEALGASRRVLAAHGNMSSPTVLFILEELRRSAAGIVLPCVVLSFGPGVAAEALLLT